MRVFKVTYTNRIDSSTWRAHILAESRQDAEEHLAKRVGFPFSITGFEDMCGLDSISDKIVNGIVEFDKKVKNTKKKKEKKQKNAGADSNA